MNEDDLALLIHQLPGHFLELFPGGLHVTSPTCEIEFDWDGDSLKVMRWTHAGKFLGISGHCPPTVESILFEIRAI